MILTALPNPRETSDPPIRRKSFQITHEPIDQYLSDLSMV